MENVKQQALEFCKEQLGLKRTKIEKSIKLLQNSLTSESKSTAGDKHETGRAMIQLEREKLGFQLKELEKQEALLYRIKLESSTGLVALGSYVQTSLMDYFLSVSLGKMDTINAFAISIKSPIGRLLLGKKEGDTFSFNGKEQKIIKIL